MKNIASLGVLYDFMMIDSVTCSR